MSARTTRTSLGRSSCDSHGTLWCASEASGGYDGQDRRAFQKLSAFHWFQSLRRVVSFQQADSFLCGTIAGTEHIHSSSRCRLTAFCDLRCMQHSSGVGRAACSDIPDERRIGTGNRWSCTTEFEKWRSEEFLCTYDGAVFVKFAITRNFSYSSSHCSLTSNELVIPFRITRIVAEDTIKTGVSKEATACFLVFSVKILNF